MLPTQHDETWRVFVAIEIPKNLRAQIFEHTTQLRKALPYVRASWTREQNLHLTLKFLGEIPVAKVEALSTAARRAANEVSAFQIAVGGCDAFPSHGPPRVLWLGIEDPSGQLSNLQRTLEDECDRAGFPREPRPFKPHLTVARIRTPHGARELAAAHRASSFAPQNFNVSELVLMRSELGPGGSRYTPLSQHPLGKGGV